MCRGDPEDLASLARMGFSNQSRHLRNCTQESTLHLIPALSGFQRDHISGKFVHVTLGETRKWEFGIGSQAVWISAFKSLKCMAKQVGRSAEIEVLDKLYSASCSKSDCLKMRIQVAKVLGRPLPAGNSSILVSERTQCVF